MAQPWAMRERLIDGQGNFGSVEGDPPAAMRYTEARMTHLGAALMEDMDKDTDTDKDKDMDEDTDKDTDKDCEDENEILGLSTWDLLGEGFEREAAALGLSYIFEPFT